ncbi:hypothetical protein KBI33_03400 [Candidatus Shapirobacteria bacterium]|nr:hypothetical protein [Candidatus Shapirobacteria bacterium]
MTEGDIETYPYPLRASELVSRPGFPPEMKPLPLGEEEREKIRQYEEPFFQELKRIKEINESEEETDLVHTIYPEAFATEEGQRVFSAIYSDETLGERLIALLNQMGITLKTREEERKIYDAFFDDLLEIATSEEQYRNYREKGCEFSRLGKALKEAGGKENGPVIIKGEAPNLELTEEEIKEIFFKADLRSIPRQLRIRLEAYSFDAMREQFARAFKEKSGEVEEIPNPERIQRVVDIKKMKERLWALRSFKRKIKAIEEKLTADDALSEGERIVLSLYRQQVNVLIAEDYKVGRVLANYPRRTEEEEEVLRLFGGASRSTTADRFSEPGVSRTLERIDHFLRGTGVEIGKNGLFETIPRKLEEYALRRAEGSPPEKTAEYEKFNSCQVNAQQAKVLASLVLAAYGFDQGERPWQITISGKRKSFAVRRDPVENAREIIIPKSCKRGLVDVLATLAHEIEGHVLRYENREACFGNSLQIARESSTGRSSVLAEAIAMRIQDETEQAMVGRKVEASPAYYQALAAKRQGGSFRECFRVVFESKAKREYGLSLEEAIKDEKYEKIFNAAYGETLRIFRSHTPLNDTSGYLETSAQLKYIEQELIVDALRKKRLGFLLYVGGIDLYSFCYLKQLGMLNLEKIKEPQMVVAHQIWPRIKTALEEGKSLEEALSAINPQELKQVSEGAH